MLIFQEAIDVRRAYMRVHCPRKIRIFLLKDFYHRHSRAPSTIVFNQKDCFKMWHFSFIQRLFYLYIFCTLIASTGYIHSKIKWKVSGAFHQPDLGSR